MEKKIIVESKIPVELIGIRIKDVRPMTQDEMSFEGWDLNDNRQPYIIELENGVLLYPSTDPEANGPGVLFGRDTKERINEQGFVLL
jgi:hypothetical protein